jgi:predicted nucleic acid-binding Zn ribbon protein
MNDKKVCLSCGEVIKGRSDKKFCSDQCRNSYNNELNSDANNYVRVINNALRKNRRILSDTIGKNEKLKISREKLNTKGFSFNFYTNMFQSKTGNTYYFCYEYGYMILEGDFVLVVMRKEFLN